MTAPPEIPLLPLAPKRQGPWIGIAVIGLLVLFAGLAIDSMRRKSVTVDEMVYFTAGYYHLKTGRFDFNTTNPPLMKLLSGFPLLYLQPDLPAIGSDPSEWNEIVQWQFAREFLYQNTVDADRILFWARLPTVFLGVLLGWMIWRFGSSLYGGRGGLVALFFYALSPNILAHSRLGTQDLALSLGMFATVWTFWRFLAAPSWGRQFAFASVFGCAVATKTTALFFGPILVLCAALVLWRRDEIGLWKDQFLVARVDPARRVRRKFVSLLVAFVAMIPVVVLVLNLAYAFDGTFSPLSTIVDPAKICAKLGLGTGTLAAVVGFLTDIPLPVPEPFLQLVKFQASRVRSGNSLYFMGELSRTGWYTLMPFAFLIKTPIATLILVATSLLGCVRWGRERTVEWMLLVSAGFVMALFCYLRSVSVGLRYILPMYPFLFVLIGRLARLEGPWDATRAVGRFATRAFLLGLMGWCAFGTVKLHPHYLAHFNEAVGGREQGHKYLVDSYLDWGQDLRGLKDYMDRRGWKSIRLAYFGSADARYYGIDYEYLPSVGLAPNGSDGRWWYETKPEELTPLQVEGGPIAISATLLAGVFFPGYYKPLQSLEPTATIGSSILIFEPSKDQAK